MRDHLVLVEGVIYRRGLGRLAGLPEVFGPWQTGTTAIAARASPRWTAYDVGRSSTRLVSSRLRALLGQIDDEWCLFPGCRLRHASPRPGSDRITRLRMLGGITSPAEVRVYPASGSTVHLRVAHQDDRVQEGGGLDPGCGGASQEPRGPAYRRCTGRSCDSASAQLASPPCRRCWPLRPGQPARTGQR